jgi:hypothetical protein
VSCAAVGPGFTDGVDFALICGLGALAALCACQKDPAAASEQSSRIRALFVIDVAPTIPL